MIATDPFKCPDCGELAAFSKKRGKHFCAECELEFDAPVQLVDPQTIFLSYAHKSEREEDFDVSEELVLLIKAELDKDGHRVWIDKEGIRSGFEWRERITSAILEHTHFLSFLSRRSVRDPGVCLNEIATALGHTRNIQTVLTGPEGQVSPPLTISHLQWHDFQDWREIQAGTKTGANGEGWDAWFSQRMELVRDTVGNAQNAQASGQLQRLKDILVPSGFEARIIQKTEGFFGRQWLFDATQDWLDNSTSRMFWLKASPGIGKSAFAAKLTHQARSAVIGFFMCDFQGMKNPEDSAREAICTLAFQMASRLPDYRAKLIYQQQVDNEKILKKSADDLFEYLITEPLNKSGKIPEATRLCLVIDGLDEAGRGNGNNALADLLVKHVNRLPEWLGVVVTSRPEPYLEQILKPLSGISVDGQTQQNQQDLVAWIEEKLPKHIQGEERRRVLDVVLEKSGGTFLYLRLVEEDKTLDISQPESLPDKLDGIFKQNFNRYFPDAQEYGNKTEPFLRLLVAAPGPLPEQMGRQVLAWSQRDLTLNVTEPMGSLLQQRDGGLVFFHASLSDWLKDPKRSGTHCVNDTGGKELGEFVWQQFEDFGNSEWKLQVISWLATLMPHTDHWQEIKDLRAAADFLVEKLRHRDAIAVRRRELARVVQTIGSGVEAANCMNSLGNTLKILGQSTASLEQYQSELAIREYLLSDDPENTVWQIDLGGNYNRIGRVRLLQGNLTGALEAYRQSLTIAERLVEHDYANAVWQCELADTHSRIGRVLHEQGNLRGALEAFRKPLAICERLVKQDPDNVRWQRNLGGCHRWMGVVLEAQGILAESLDAYRKGLAIAEHLAARNPDNMQGQRDLAANYHQIGGVLLSQGNLAGALEAYLNGLAIPEHLAAQDPENVGWQHQLGVSHSRIGELMEVQGELLGALKALRKSVAIRVRLTTQDPSNAVWKRDLGIDQAYLALVELRRGNILEVQQLIDLASITFNGLRKEDVPGTEIDWAAVCAIGAEAARIDGEDAQEQSWHHRLAGVEFNPSGVVGRFGVKILPLILTHLRRAIEHFQMRRRDISTKNEGALDSAVFVLPNELVISERPSTNDSDNASSERALASSMNYLSAVLMERGQVAEALSEFMASAIIFKQLSNSDGAVFLVDYAAALTYAALCHNALDQDEAGLALDLQIAEADWTPVGIVGVFRRNSIPKIVARLDSVFEQCSAELQLRIANRCLAGLEAVGVTDLDVWRARVAQAPEP